MDATFLRAHKFTAQYEGGLTDHPADPCGTTNHGVSLHWLRELEQKKCRKLACTNAQAVQLFKKHFWDATECAKFPLPIAIVLYDGAVNMGAPRAVRQLQQALNLVADIYLDEPVSIAEDAINGVKTQDMAAALAESSLDFYTARQAVRLREKFYRELVQRRADLKPFLKGWQNRCAALLNYLAQLEREVYDAPALDSKN